MKAYIIARTGGPEVLTLTDIPSPEPKHDEVRIRVSAFGLNRAEAHRRAGEMGPIVGAVMPGIEAVDEVISDASAMRWSTCGDRDGWDAVHEDRELRGGGRGDAQQRP